MCGLIAMHTAEKNGFTASERDEFKLMMHLNSLRGSHSTGIAGVNMREDWDKVSIVKAVGSPSSLYQWEETDTFLTRVVQKFTTIIGHGRYATKGAINATNAHPFEEGHITLAHNGVINNFFALKDYTNKVHQKIEVDSHLIAKLFEEQEAIEVLPKVEGAYVFIWYDSRNQTLNIARNNARPLFVGTCKNRNTLFFSSEAETIEWNESRNKTPMVSIEEIKPYKIYTYNKESLTPTITEYKQYYAPYSYPSQNKHRHGHGYSFELDDDYAQTYVNKKFPTKPQALLLPSNLKDRKVLENKKDNKLEVGQTIIFSLDDYRLETGYIQVWGYCDDYPDVIFKASLFDIAQESLYTMDFVQGDVRSILPNMETNAGYNWNVFVANVILLADDPNASDNDDTKVNIMSIDGVMESLTKFRLKQLGAKGCSWCASVIGNSAYDHPEELILQVSKGFEDEVVCPSCATALLPTLIGERNVH